MRQSIALQRAQEKIPFVLKTLKVDSIAEAKKRLETWCSTRLGIPSRIYWKLILYTDAVPNRMKKNEDRILFNKELSVRKACSLLKISKEKLKHRLETFQPIPVTSVELRRIRDFFGIEYNQQRAKLDMRPPEQKRRDAKIVEMWSANKTYREIAEALDTTAGTIITRVNRMRARTKEDILPMRQPFGYVPQPDCTPENVGRLLRSGVSVKELAKKFQKPYAKMHAQIGAMRYRHPEANIPYLRK